MVSGLEREGDWCEKADLSREWRRPRGPGAGRRGRNRFRLHPVEFPARPAAGSRRPCARCLAEGVWTTIRPRPVSSREPIRPRSTHGAAEPGAVVAAPGEEALFHAEEFNSWSLKMFVYLLAYGSFRVLIWIDHMGLRVATMVNLSFQGMDKLDEIVARFIGASSTKRYIPEAVKRFTTWAPLLIPFYIPRGPAWDYVWSQAESIQNAAHKGGIQSFIKSLSVSGMFGM